jgi:ribosomal protein S12 methylthiotransferase
MKELIIVAQDTCNYGRDIEDGNKLGELIETISGNINDSAWIRVLYMHPDHISMDLISRLKGIKNFIPYFDIPFQSGSDRILKLMNRSGSKKFYLDLVQNIRKHFDDIILRSTFITGFPGETEKDFAETLDFVDKLQAEWIGAFTYSREENTASGTMKGQVSESVKKKRLNELLNKAEQISALRLKRFIGRKEKILIEEKVEQENLYIGRFWGQAPEVDGLTVVSSGKANPGEFLEAEIKKLNDKDFYAADI